jgi:hypothetical protein
VGRPSLTVDGVPVSLDVPGTGWGRYRNVAISRSIAGPQDAEGVIYWASVSDRSVTVPCPDVLSLPVDASAADVASAVARAPGTELVSGPSDLTLGGRPAKHVVVTVREDLGCDPGYFYSWPSAKGGPFWGGTRAGDTVSAWIVEVDGRLLFISAMTHVDSGDPEHVLVGPAFKQEIQEIVDSVRFE